MTIKELEPLIGKDHVDALIAFVIRKMQLSFFCGACFGICLVGTITGMWNIFL
jgi:hypothetical protein